LLVYNEGKEVIRSPFAQALFYDWLGQAKRWTETHVREVYYVSHKDFIGYLIKKTEACLRKTLQFKHKITVNPKAVNRYMWNLRDYDISLQEIDDTIEKSVADCHTELTRTVVVVDHHNLARIREEAQGTQDKLIVEETAEMLSLSDAIAPIEEPDHYASAGDSWDLFRNMLSEMERKALLVVSTGESDIKTFADENGVMLEVLVDSINEKAADCIGDNILDEDMDIYGEYKEKVGALIDEEV